MHAHYIYTHISIGDVFLELKRSSFPGLSRGGFRRRSELYTSVLGKSNALCALSVAFLCVASDSFAVAVAIALAGEWFSEYSSSTASPALAPELRFAYLPTFNRCQSMW